MTVRYLWTLEREGRDPRGGLDTVETLAEVARAEDLPGIMPPDWLVATLLMDEDADGAASHSSPHGWMLRVKRVA